MLACAPTPRGKAGNGICRSQKQSYLSASARDAMQRRRRLGINAMRVIITPGEYWDWLDQQKRAKAYNAVHRAIKKGTLIRLPCEACGEPKTQAHHDDYDGPLEVR